MSRGKRRSGQYKVGDRIPIYLNKDTSQDVLNWLNLQRDISPSILDVLDKYVSGKLVSVEGLEGIVGSIGRGDKEDVYESSKLSDKELNESLHNREIEVDIRKQNKLKSPELDENKTKDYVENDTELNEAPVFDLNFTSVSGSQSIFSKEK